MDLVLEYFFIYNPILIPENPKAKEVEIMDAKKIFFYPTLVDIHKQRNLMGMGEGFVAFYNIFGSKDKEQCGQETQVLVLNNRIMLSKCINNHNYIVLIMGHKIGNTTEGKYKVINRISRVNIPVYKRIIDRFCKIYRTVFEPVQYYLSSQQNLIEFTENILRFVESYFYLKEGNGSDKRIIDIPSKLFRDLIIKKKINSSLTLPIIRTIIESANDYSNFYDLLVYKSSYLIFSRLEEDAIKTFLSLLVDFDIKGSRLIETKPKIKFSQFFESFYDLEFLDALNKDEYIKMKHATKSIYVLIYL